MCLQPYRVTPYSTHMYHTCLLTLTASDAPFRRFALLCASALCASSIKCSWPRPALCLHCIEWTAPPPALSTQCSSSVWHLMLNASILCGMARHAKVLYFHSLPTRPPERGKPSEE